MTSSLQTRRIPGACCPDCTVYNGVCLPMHNFLMKEQEQKVLEEKQQREKYWQNRMKSERESWDFYFREAIEKHSVNKNCWSSKPHELLKELGLGDSNSKKVQQ